MKTNTKELAILKEVGNAIAAAAYRPKMTLAHRVAAARFVLLTMAKEQLSESMVRSASLAAVEQLLEAAKRGGQPMPQDVFTAQFRGAIISLAGGDDFINFNEALHFESTMEVCAHLIYLLEFLCSSSAPDILQQEVEKYKGDTEEPEGYTVSKKTLSANAYITKGQLKGWIASVEFSIMPPGSEDPDQSDENPDQPDQDNMPKFH